LLPKISAQFVTNDFSRLYSPKEMGTVYAASKIVLNVPVKDDVNMRVFEGMASGALLVTERTGNGLTELFTPGEHLVTYEHHDEVPTLVRHYLDDVQERERIARNGQQLVSQQHTYDHRIETMLAVTKDADWGRRAPARSWPQSEALLRNARLQSLNGQVNAACDLWSQLARLHGASWHTMAATGYVARAIARRTRLKEIVKGRFPGRTALAGATQRVAARARARHQ
jgi:hypothetical protein